MRFSCKFPEMFSRLSTEGRLRGLLAAADAGIPEAKASYRALIAKVRRARRDPRRISEAGAALEEIARAKLYRLGDHATFADMLASIGISRTTAHKWRVVARSLMLSSPGPTSRSSESIR